jgi:hypothetical protein
MIRLNGVQSFSFPRIVRPDNPDETDVQSGTRTDRFGDGVFGDASDGDLPNHTEYHTFHTAKTDQ